MRTSISITGSVDTLATDFTRRLYPERMPVLRDLYLGGSAAPERRPAGCERRRLPGGAGPRAQPQDCTALGRIHAGTMIRAPTEIVRKGPADMRCVIAAADPGRASRLSAGRRRASGSSHRRFCKEVGSDAGWSLWVVTRRSACARQFRGGGCRRHACPDPKQALPTSASRRSDVSACYDRFDRERRFARSHCTAGPDRWRWLAASMPTMSRHQVRCRNHGALDRTATGRRSSSPRLAKQEERSCVFAICCRSSACSRSRPAKTRRRPRPPASATSCQHGAGKPCASRNDDEPGSGQQAVANEP